MRKGTIVSINVLVMVLVFSVAGIAQRPGSVPAPEGWGQCPRCQNNAARMAANAKYKVEGHAFNPHDLSGVWGFGGVGGAFTDAPPLTVWGKQPQSATITGRNRARD